MIAIRLALAALLSALSLSPARAAIDVDDLLPIDEAFALQAQATERGRIEFTWDIADGYYLYRHRMAVQPVDASFKSNPLELPSGEKYTDEFFGEVETYRDAVTAVLTGAAASARRASSHRALPGLRDVGVWLSAAFQAHDDRAARADRDAMRTAMNAPVASPDCGESALGTGRQSARLGLPGHAASPADRRREQRRDGRLAAAR